MKMGTKLFGHDSSIFIMDCEERQLFGLDTERVTRIKHDPGICAPAINALKEWSELNPKNRITLLNSGFEMYYFTWYPPIWHDEVLRRIILGRKVKKLQRIEKILKFKPYHLPFIWFYSKIPRSFKTKLSQKHAPLVLNVCRSTIEKATGLNIREIKGIDHHTCHVASAFFFSPYRKAVCITLDGFGDGYSSKVFIGSGKELNFLYGTECEVNKGFSVGRLYSTVTAILGLIPNCDEGKVEALAAFGNYKNKLFEFLMKNTIVRKGDGISIEATKELENFRLDTERLRYLRKQLGDANLAATVQKWLEEIGVQYITAIIEDVGIKKLCLSGGVFANVKLNLQIFERCKLDGMYIFPAMSDSGCAAGAMVLEKVYEGENVDWIKECEMPYWGPSYSEEQVKEAIKKYNLPYEYLGDSWPEYAAYLISKGNIISIFQGRMEYGPRALGNRSVLADPRNKEVKDVINSTIKRRKWYQPFCPSVLESERNKIFENSYKNKHMTCAFRVKEEFREVIPAVIHVDGTARPQIVEKNDNLTYYQLLKALKQEIGIGVVLNTSFNLHGRAIVMTPEHALQDFVDCGLDYLIMEGYIVKRKIKNKNGNTLNRRVTGAPRN